MSDITANVVVSMPNQLFTLARSFKAASGGKIYIGQIDTDPVNPANQIQVYLENEDGSHVPVAQPLIINAAGYPVYNGQIAKFVTVQGHSMAVYDMYGTQQFYYPNILKYDPDQLRVELNGPNGASIVGLKQGGKVQDALPDVYLPAEGVVIQSAAMIANGTAVDMTAKLQAAIDKAKSLGVKIDTGIRSYFGPAPSGYIHVKSSFDYTGLKGHTGFLPVMVSPDSFVPNKFTAESPSRGMVWKNMNAQYDADGKQLPYTTAGYQDIGPHGIYAIAPMPENIVGIVHTTAYSEFSGCVWGRRFANAIYMANCYDNTITSQWAIVDSGSMNYPPFMVGSYPASGVADESNSMTFPRLLLHSNKYRDAEVVGSKINVISVHAEDCTIGSITGMTPRGFDQFAPGGIASLVFATTGGSLGNINYTINNASTTHGCLLVNMLGTHVDQVYADRPIIDIKISDVYFLGRGGSVGSVYTSGSFYTDGGSKIVIGSVIAGGNLSNKNVRSSITRADVTGNVDNSGTIDYLTCGGTFTQDQFGIINGGQVTGAATLSASSEITNVTFNGAFTSSATLPRMKRCTFNGSFTNTGGGRFENCTIPGFDIKSAVNTPTYIDCTITGAVTGTTASGKAIFRNSAVGSYNFDNGSSLTVRVFNGSCGGISMTGISSSAIILDGVSCTAGNSIAGWSIPSGTGVGFGTKTINPYTAGGWMLISNSGVATWKSVQW